MPTATLRSRCGRSPISGAVRSRLVAESVDLALEVSGLIRVRRARTGQLECRARLAAPPDLLEQPATHGVKRVAIREAFLPAQGIHEVEAGARTVEA